MKIDVINLFIQDMNETVRFYRLLGFDIAEGAETKEYVRVENAGIKFAFYTKKLVANYFGEHAIVPVTGFAFEISVRVNSVAEVDQLHFKMVEKGYRSFKEPENTSWGQRAGFLLDPDGNMVEICAYLKS